MNRVLCSFLVALAVLAPTAAFAHSAVINSQPRPNSTVNEGPTLVRLGFNIPLIFVNEAYQGEIQITDSQGKALKPVCSSATKVSIQEVIDLTGPSEYKLTWRAVSEDGHIVGSAYNFKVSDERSDNISAAQLCNSIGLNPGDLKPASQQSFNQTPEVEGFWFVIAAIALLVLLAYFLIRKKN